ncbi:hypothetical protein C7M84_008601, partial [Penaeus vannamei]
LIPLQKTNSSLHLAANPSFHAFQSSPPTPTLHPTLHHLNPTPPPSLLLPTYTYCSSTLQPLLTPTTNPHHLQPTLIHLTFQSPSTTPDLPLPLSLSIYTLSPPSPLPFFSFPPFLLDFLHHSFSLPPFLLFLSSSFSILNVPQTYFKHDLLLPLTPLFFFPPPSFPSLPLFLSFPFSFSPLVLCPSIPLSCPTLYITLLPLSLQPVLSSLPPTSSSPLPPLFDPSFFLPPPSSPHPSFLLHLFLTPAFSTPPLPSYIPPPFSDPFSSSYLLLSSSLLLPPPPLPPLPPRPLLSTLSLLSAILFLLPPLSSLFLFLPPVPPALLYSLPSLLFLVLSSRHRLLFSDPLPLPSSISLSTSPTVIPNLPPTLFLPLANSTFLLSHSLLPSPPPLTLSLLFPIPHHPTFPLPLSPPPPPFFSLLLLLPPGYHACPRLIQSISKSVSLALNFPLLPSRLIRLASGFLSPFSCVLDKSFFAPLYSSIIIFCFLSSPSPPPFSSSCATSLTHSVPTSFTCLVLYFPPLPKHHPFPPLRLSHSTPCLPPPPPLPSPPPQTTLSLPPFRPSSPHPYPTSFPLPPPPPLPSPSPNHPVFVPHLLIPPLPFPPPHPLLSPPSPSTPSPERTYHFLACFLTLIVCRVFERGFCGLWRPVIGVDEGFGGRRARRDVLMVSGVQS